jgi:hypothetical protein
VNLHELGFLIFLFLFWLFGEASSKIVAWNLYFYVIQESVSIKVMRFCQVCVHVLDAGFIVCGYEVLYKIKVFEEMNHATSHKLSL